MFSFSVSNLRPGVYSIKLLFLRYSDAVSFLQSSMIFEIGDGEKNIEIVVSLASISMLKKPKRS